MIQSPNVLFMVLLATLIGAVTWFVSGDKLSRLGAFVIMTAICGLLPAIAFPLAESPAVSDSGLWLLVCNYLIMIPAFAWFNSGSYVAMAVGWAIQAITMASIGFYVWDGIGRRKRMRTSPSTQPRETGGA